MIESRDSRFDALLGEAFAAEIVCESEGQTEGPVWLEADGSLLFSDLNADAIMRWRDGELAPYRAPSNVTDGMALDGEGRLLACEHVTSRITRTEHGGGITIIASHFRGLELNSPNDLAVSRDGSVFFTDPPYGRTKEWGLERPTELPFSGVFRLEPGVCGPEVVAVDFERPNGICLSPDESRLYISDSARGHLRCLDLSGGTWGRAELFVDLSDAEDPWVPDGMAIDARGNLFCTGPGGLWVVSPQADVLGRIRFPTRAANACWGDADRGTLFVTCDGAVWALSLATGGSDRGREGV